MIVWDRNQVVDQLGHLVVGFVVVKLLEAILGGLDLTIPAAIFVAGVTGASREQGQHGWKPWHAGAWLDFAVWCLGGAIGGWVSPVEIILP